ncbi:MAG: hypothetical protein ACD_26C00096G0002 [uncultured bacterium]|nr:MAG: hypothetical protein ACD_26C00096G0002 [uncultured bacterium]OGH90925.1 MAG: hypothetical protein A2507_05170 [Candidatus Magasanikbacteria bacterium RIFOXYD12_FULL_33_17]HAO52095.1 hypothetical protein [Candidatus Magasanikbacteria bacterium]
MEVVYYFDEELQLCPVKKYLERFLIDEFDTERIKNKKKNILALIYKKVQYIKDNPTESAGFLKTLHNHNFIEIKSRKNKNVVIRILYSRCNSKIVLLNAFEKPDNYDTDKIRKDVEKYYITTDKYLENFKNNPNSYENYR